MQWRSCVAFTAFCLLSWISTKTDAAIVVAFSDDFDGGQSFSAGVSGGWSDVTHTESVQGYSGYGTGSNVFTGAFLRNTSTGNPASASVLTLTGLPTHSSIDLNLLFAAIDSWDVVSTGDTFNVTIDGIPLFAENFTSNPVASLQGYVAPPNVQLTSRPFPQLGFNEGFVGRLGFEDGAYDLGLDPLFDAIPHTSSTLHIEFFASGPGWTGGGDESFGLENVEVRLNGVQAVPEPSSGLMALSGFAFLVLNRTRRRLKSLISSERAPVASSSRP